MISSSSRSSAAGPRSHCAKPIVELGPAPLRDQLVGGVADEQVGEAVAIVAGEHRAAPGARARAARARPAPASTWSPRWSASSAATTPRWNRGPRPPPPRSPAGRCCGSPSTRAASSAWMLGGVAPAGSSARIATRCSRKSGLPSAAARISNRRSRAALPAGEPAQEPGRVGVGERPQAHRRAAPERRRPRRPALEQVVARQADDGTGARRHVARQVLDQVEQRRLGPVDVVEHDHQRCGRASDSSSRRTAHWTSWADAVDCDRPIAADDHRRREHVLLVAGHEPLERGHAAELVDDLLSGQ